MHIAKISILAQGKYINRFISIMKCDNDALENCSKNHAAQSETLAFIFSQSLKFSTTAFIIFSRQLTIKIFLFLHKQATIRGWFGLFK